MGYKRVGWRKGVLDYAATIQAGTWHIMVWRGLGEPLKGKTTKGCGISNLRWGGFNNGYERQIHTDLDRHKHFSQLDKRNSVTVLPFVGTIFNRINRGLA
jgi:hypothetical protein